MIVTAFFSGRTRRAIRATKASTLTDTRAHRAKFQLVRSLEWR